MAETKFSGIAIAIGISASVVATVKFLSKESLQGVGWIKWVLGISTLILLLSLIVMIGIWGQGEYPEGQQTYYVISSIVIFGLGFIQLVLSGMHLSEKFELKQAGGGIWVKDW